MIKNTYTLRFEINSRRFLYADNENMGIFHLMMQIDTNVILGIQWVTNIKWYLLLTC